MIRSISSPTLLVLFGFALAGASLACDPKGSGDEGEETGGADSCEPGSQFAAADGCNTCTCPDSGKRSEAACTEIACGGTHGAGTMTAGGTAGGTAMTTGGTAMTTGDPTSAGTGDATGGDTGGHDPDHCVPGSVFDDEDGCNQCTCPESGKKSEAACDDAACVSCEAPGACSETEVCNFGLDNCGVLGIPGSCVPKPEACDAGGVPTCTCDGTVQLNPCSALAANTDVMIYGGCELNPGTFRCGDMDCALGTEYCHIAFNDVAGEGPEYFASCHALPAECGAAPSCECLPVTPFGDCLTLGTNLMVFETGG